MVEEKTLGDYLVRQLIQIVYRGKKKVETKDKYLYFALVLIYIWLFFMMVTYEYDFDGYVELTWHDILYMLINQMR